MNDAVEPSAEELEQLEERMRPLGYISLAQAAGVARGARRI